MRPRSRALASVIMQRSRSDALLLIDCLQIAIATASLVDLALPWWRYFDGQAGRTVTGWGALGRFDLRPWVGADRRGRPHWWRRSPAEAVGRHHRVAARRAGCGDHPDRRRQSAERRV